MLRNPKKRAVLDRIKRLEEEIAKGREFLGARTGTGSSFVSHMLSGLMITKADNQMGEQLIASPVPAANRLLIRGEQHLFCIAAQ